MMMMHPTILNRIYEFEHAIRMCADGWWCVWPGVVCIYMRYANEHVCYINNNSVFGVPRNGRSDNFGTPNTKQGAKTEPE